MADIDFYGGIGDDNGEEGFGLDDDLDGEDNYNTDDKLSPLQKLEKYMQSDNVYTRQMVARGMLDTIRAVEDEEEDCTPVLEAMVKLSEDSDPIVRSELMEQIPHLAMYCQENKDLFPNSVSLYILPMVVRYLNDRNNQVRKTSQAALLVLLEQELISKADIEEQVVSVILDLASPDSMDDYRTEAVALMSKMSQLLGRDMTERLFLSRFCEMCTDPLFHVRKVCAANFGDFCTVVGQDNTERELLPKFYYLCEDGVWGVRKACAECFMAVSCSCSLDVRRGELSNLFVNLLCDLSRWVSSLESANIGVMADNIFFQMK
ncbi:serine/threonine-protein phosphatase 4 regulatory subunit 1 [Mytilus galloprovincialis]|uniref:Serine/threonine-protein phosphatase 4 regulatory subunit 1 n=2 Tax=Mytilus galloprovincialis TaxID=29158 RepID=A0A8B6GDG8_MYTGA|nr:serine/threonine-protein phosphatase 4 regulatory subunit 1 [Mytilus galloprovincialis]